MASWQNDSDIARDLDYLSGIQSPSRKIKSYTVRGRGQPINVKEAEVFDNPFRTEDEAPKEEFTWFQQKPALEKFPESLGRGKKLEFLKENYRSQGKELEVHEQVRAAMGPGYSNEFIEASFKQRLKCGMKNDHGKLPVEQFEDSEVIKKSTESKVKCSDVQEIKCSRRKKPRQYRNAVLESLAKLESSENHPVVQTNNSSRSKLTNIPPAGYFPGKCYAGSFLNKESENSFALNESDFPKL